MKFYVFSYELRSPENSSLSTRELSDKFIVYYYAFVSQYRDELTVKFRFFYYISIREFSDKFIVLY